MVRDLNTEQAIKGRDIVKQKVPFGGTRYFELLLKRA